MSNVSTAPLHRVAAYRPDGARGGGRLARLAGAGAAAAVTFGLLHGLLTVASFEQRLAAASVGTSQSHVVAVAPR